MKRIAIVEDDAELRGNLAFVLGRVGYEVATFDHAEELSSWIARGDRFDLALVDVRLPGESGIDLVRSVVRESSPPAVIVMSGEATLSEAVAAVRLGVHDFLEKPFSSERLLLSVENALRHRRLEGEVADLREVVAGRDEILGTSARIDELRHLADRAATAEATVLLLGESGTGKELVAERIHRRGPRRKGPFVKVNCAALPANLVEGELFGHARGAFTGALKDRAGLFEAADGGVLMLDEIGDMEPPLQAGLLRVLEDGRVRRLGETRERSVDTRILAATNRDLESAVANRTFRRDLYFRLAQLVLELPPLRERGEDVVELYEHFLRAASVRARRPTPTTEPACLNVLRRYSWPGNIRELKGLCERLITFGADPIRPDDLPSTLTTETSPRESGVVRLPESSRRLTLREFRVQCEREYVEAVLAQCGWRFARAARILGLQRSYLYEKARELGLRRPDDEETDEDP